jgi:hypothetical protein
MTNAGAAPSKRTITINQTDPFFQQLTHARDKYMETVRNICQVQNIPSKELNLIEVGEALAHSGFYNVPSWVVSGS